VVLKVHVPYLAGFQEMYTDHAYKIKLLIDLKESLPTGSDTLEGLVIGNMVPGS